MRLFVAVLLGYACFAEAAPHVVPRTVVEERLSLARRGNDARHAALIRLFAAAGCKGDRLTQQAVPRYDLPNIICTIPGQTTATILITAHYDMTGPGLGVGDNWGGTSLLPSLYETFAGTTPRHTLLFIGFSEEEEGLVGAKHYVAAAARAGTLDDIAAMINMDCVGMASMRVWHSKSDPILVRRLKSIAKELGIRVTLSSLDDRGRMDSFPFHKQGVPVLGLHGLAMGNYDTPHSRHDDFDAVDARHLYDAYRLVAKLIEDLDR